MIGIEALIRWHHPERGLLLPAAFLLNIENHILSVELGEWVIETALAQLETWQSQGLETSVSVNIAVYHLQQANFIDRLGILLAAHSSIQPERLELEVLESSAIDDFGTGYSSLTYLKRLPAHVLKIDQSFVRDMLDDPEDLAILEGVLGLATAFDRSAIAEGVESVEHGIALLQLGCEFAQGYVIAHPMPAAELPDWHQNWRPDPRWSQSERLNRSQLQVLFAGIEHRAWISRLSSFLEGSRVEPPPMDQHLCRFGRWLDDSGREYQQTHAEVFASIDSLHHQVHDLANELQDLQRQGRSAEACAGLSQLRELRDRLLVELHQLLA
jgi:EAL domain-containing protein (putative c-di-GMP-specific phosphodiesterase class I)